MERSGARGGERASIAILHRTEIDTGTAGVTRGAGEGGRGGGEAVRGGREGGKSGLPAGGFCIFRESITNSSANISGAWLSATLEGFARQLPVAGFSCGLPGRMQRPILSSTETNSGRMPCRELFAPRRILKDEDGPEAVPQKRFPIVRASDCICSRRPRIFPAPGTERIPFRADQKSRLNSVPRDGTTRAE